MKITPIEIRQKEFEKVFRGYEKEAVDAYLQSLSMEWERLMDDNKSLSKKVESTEKEVDRLREVESSLFRTLKSAEDTGNSLIEAANKKSELYVREAQMNSETMLTEARYRAKSMLEEAEEKSKDILGGLQHDVKDLEANYRQITEIKDNLLREIKNLLSDFNDKVNRHTETGSERKNFDSKIRESKQLISDKNHNFQLEQRIIAEAKPSSDSDSVSEPKSNSVKDDQASFFDQL